MNHSNRLIKRLEALIKSIGHVIGIIDTPQDNLSKGQNIPTNHVGNAKIEVTNKQTKSKSVPHKKVVSAKTNISDIYFLGASNNNHNHNTVKPNNPYVKEKTYNDYSLHRDNEYLLYDEDEFIDYYAEYDADYDAY